MNILTCAQLAEISDRIEEINDLLDQCGDNDEDVFDNLQSELDQHIEVLERSYKYARFAERGLRIV